MVLLVFVQSCADGVFHEYPPKSYPAVSIIDRGRSCDRGLCGHAPGGKYHARTSDKSVVGSGTGGF